MKVWCLLRDQLAHVKPVEAAFGAEAEFIHDGEWNPAAMLKAHPNIVLSINDYSFDIARCLDAARKNKIPSLTLQDGILEWRCQYENPLFGAGGGAPQHQPVLTDKIACIGHQSLRQIAAWGNADKVELTGMPRLDPLCSNRFTPAQNPGSRLLVMTAKNPGFTAEQRNTTLRSLRELKEELDALQKIKVFWRVSKNVAQELKVENQLNEIGSAELTRVVEQADAVISTPSTAMLEAMLLGRPVAALDYHNVPRFVQTAWTISARGHIRNVVAEILNPSPAKMAFQQEQLADNLVCDGCAAQRVRRLMEVMVEFSRRQNCAPLPVDILGEQNSYKFFQPFPLNQLYGTQSVFAQMDLGTLQVRLARAENENARLKIENRALKKNAAPGSWLKNGMRRLLQATGLH